MHVEGDRLEKPIIIGIIEGKWKIGRPHTRWMDEIKETSKLMMDELREVTREKIGWRQLIMSPSQ